VTEPFALAAFLARWGASIRHDLAASESETTPLAELLAMADAEDAERWARLEFGYAHPRGAPWLRETIAKRYHGLEPADILCCAGAQEAATCIARALLGPEDHAVVVLPIYQPSEQAITARAPTAGVALEERGGEWILDLDRVAAALRPNTRLILTNFPNSPTGAQLDRAAFDALIALCRARGIWLVNDEVYRQTDRVADERLPPVADLYERGISIDGLSKGFGLPGLRVGWAACRDRDLLTRALLAKNELSSCLAAASEVLAQIALKAEAPIVRRNRAIGRRNDERLQDVLRRLPDLFEPAPSRNLAFACPRYVGPGSASAFAVSLARAAGILVLPLGVWHSPLAPRPADRLRISLGQLRSGPGLDALALHLREARRPELVA